MNPFLFSMTIALNTLNYVTSYIFRSYIIVCVLVCTVNTYIIIIVLVAFPGEKMKKCIINMHCIYILSNHAYKRNIELNETTFKIHTTNYITTK